jgi:hypothetical protein
LVIGFMFFASRLFNKSISSTDNQCKFSRLFSVIAYSTLYYFIPNFISYHPV